MTWFYVIIPGVCVLALIPIKLRQYTRYRARNDSADGWAAAHGFTQVRRQRSWGRKKWGRPFGVGRERRGENVLTGNFQGRPAVCFTLHYATRQNGPGDTTDVTRHYSAYYTLGLPRAVPTVRVLRRSPLPGRVRQPQPEVGLGDPYFESAFAVHADDPHVAASVLTPAVRLFLTQTPDAPGFMLVDDRLLVQVGTRVDVDQVEHWLGYLSAVAGHLPPQLTR